MASIGSTLHRLSASAAGLALLGTVLAAAPVLAADIDSTPPLAYKAPAPVVEQSPWQIRLRLLGVISENDGSVRGVPGSNLDVSDSVVPELDITYYFTKNWAAELILGVTPHDINGAGSISSLNKIGEVWLLPPTLTLQYHFTDFGAFKPYIGAGINYTFFFDQKAYSADSIDVKDTFGWALQAGFDYMLDEHWGFNVDVKKLFLRPDFDVVVAGQPLTGKANLDPWIVGVGVTYRF
ncbi:OmpW/AlkL family protein [Ancylobacter rudongensis]|uniref:Outer membrane protein n=1 Tax=Ancylobacter rudongensis TaxID=177413 RepID=A0A1G4U0B4_9HYPH|nr:OmpW family protein [Ancylobacter rudongensis]SCW87074.1 outer membrane protein [Ancylobacter rudongensis]